MRRMICNNFPCCVDEADREDWATYCQGPRRRLTQRRHILGERRGIDGSELVGSCMNIASPFVAFMRVIGAPHSCSTCPSSRLFLQEPKQTSILHGPAARYRNMRRIHSACVGHTHAHTVMRLHKHAWEHFHWEIRIP